MTDGPIDDLESDSRCVMCDAASHPRCETYTHISMGDPAKVPLGESHEDHLVDVPLCLAHFEAFEAFASGRLSENVEASE